MKRINTTTRYLLLILVAAILNRLTDGTMNLIITTCLCLALIPAAIRMDKEDKEYQEWMDEEKKEAGSTEKGINNTRLAELHTFRITTVI